MEGCSRWQFFWRVSFPLLMPTTLSCWSCGINASGGRPIVVMTRGGPDNASSLLLFYIYETGFKFWDSG